MLFFFYKRHLDPEICPLRSEICPLRSEICPLRSKICLFRSKKKTCPLKFGEYFFLFSSYPLNSARIAHGQQVESKEFPNQWKNDPESHAQANLTLNTFAHETVDLSRFPNLILDNYEQDYLIQEDVKKPAEQFQSFHFHHASAGKI